MSNTVVLPDQHRRFTPANPTLTPTPETPTQQRQRQPQPQALRQQPAAEGSLRSLLLTHSSKRLYVHPIKWTALHLSLLCCNVIVDQPVPFRRRHFSEITLPQLEDVLAYYAYLHRSKLIWDLNHNCERIVYFMAEVMKEEEVDLRWGPTTLVLRYNQLPVCRLPVPLLAWGNGRLSWAYIDSCWIDHKYKKCNPRESTCCGRGGRVKRESELLISPFCMAIMIAMAQQVLPQQRVTLFVPHHERLPSNAILQSVLYEYTLEASQIYLQKFFKPYDAFESNLTVHRRTIPLHGDYLHLLFRAMRHATTGCSEFTYKAKKAADASKEGDTAISLPAVNSNKRKALDTSDSDIPSKVVKSSKP